MIKVDIAKAYFEDEEGKLDLDSSLMLSGKFAGVCYDQEGYNHLKDEAEEKTRRRISLTKDNGHHSVYDHIYMSLNITNIPKIMAMVLNNEKEYTTSEKSARYTPIKPGKDSVITEEEHRLYEKWMEIFKRKIKDMYGDVYDDNKIKKLAQENARYLVTVFMPTTMVYTVSLRQINYIASWLEKYIAACDESKDFERKLAASMREFIEELKNLNILDAGLLTNDKNRSISLFGKNLGDKKDYFGDVYATIYKGSFASLAQAQRHRTLDYKMELMEEKEFFVPPILDDDPALMQEWLNDIKSVANVYPTGELVMIYERGTYENFILKCKERLCSAAQLEIMKQTKETLESYYDGLKSNHDPLAEDMEKYTHGARCTFPDYKCSSPCGFKEGINLTRKI